MFLNDLLISQGNPAEPHSQVDTQMFTIMYNKTLSQVLSLSINTHDGKEKLRRSVCARPTRRGAAVKDMLAPVNQFQINSKGFLWQFNLKQPCCWLLTPVHWFGDKQTKHVVLSTDQHSLCIYCSGCYIHDWQHIKNWAKTKHNKSSRVSRAEK